MLRQLQNEVEAWTRHNFPALTPTQALLGVVEEVGELSHAELKMQQRIRGTKANHHAQKIDAVGDIVIYLAEYCTRTGIDFERAVRRTWAIVKERDWTGEPLPEGE